MSAYNAGGFSFYTIRAGIIYMFMSLPVHYRDKEQMIGCGMLSTLYFLGELKIYNRFQEDFSTTNISGPDLSPFNQCEFQFLLINV